MTGGCCIAHLKISPENVKIPIKNSRNLTDCYKVSHLRVRKLTSSKGNYFTCFFLTRMDSNVSKLGINIFLKSGEKK